MPGTDLVALKSIIGQNLRLNQGRHDLDIQTKISMPTGSTHIWFQLFYVQILYNDMKTLGGFDNFNDFEVTSIQKRVHAFIPDDFGRFTKANFKYTIIIRENNTVECTCQKSQLERIPCSHVLAVCRLRGIDPSNFVSHYYHIQTLINTWRGQWHVYDNQLGWPEHESHVLVLEHRFITLERRRHSRIPMWLDLLHKRRREH